MKASVLSLCILLTAVTAVDAQHALGGNGPYDPDVPTPASVLGYELGERFTPHHLVSRYLEAVANASPRVTLDTLGHSFEGREVLLATISSEANMGRLDEIRAGARLLGDPRGAADAELERAVARTPAVVWLGYSIHGNEASGVEAGLATLYQLAAGQDAETRMLLDSTVVLIDPVQNPDGHERHAQDVMRSRGALRADPYPGSLENSGQWPGARTSHYLFDLNRDWFIHSHPETRARISAFHDWYPHVAVDLHEMGSNSTYFFSPPMEPINKNVHQTIRKWWDIFASGNAQAFAENGWGFFTREGYDEFWPGYGISWPVLTGAIGMTYEQASSNGGAIRRNDGSILTLAEAAAHHYTASMATVRTVALRREERLRDYLQFRRSAVDEADDGEFRSVVIAQDGQGRADALVSMLRSNAIEVGRLTEATNVRNAGGYGDQGTSSLRAEAGWYVVDMAQPQGRLARALLEPDAVLDSTFIRAELESREAGQRDRFYDVTAWSLPFTFRVPAWTAPGSVGPTRPVETVTASTPTPPSRASFGYVFAPGDEASLRLLGALLADSVRVRRAAKGFAVPGGEFPHGAFLVTVNRNGADIHDRVRDHAARTGATVVAVNNPLVLSGTDLGSNSVRPIPIPRVALVGGEGTSSYSHGAAWYTFDQLLRFPVSRVDLSGLARTLDDFNVVVLPSAYGIGGRLGDSGVEALRRWVRAGGTLITLDGATSWLASEASGLSRLRQLEAPAADSLAGAPLPTSVPGAILRTVADTLSPLLMGVDQAEVPVLMNGSGILVR
ncbi:MAG TPA: M14 family metallopeptidase, partial [Longimicrobiales bacterium]|nr:M14 family metallopeptidase [Longimicrobiales bacterium]